MSLSLKQQLQAVYYQQEIYCNNLHPRLKHHGARFVGGDGDPEAPAVIVAEAPGEDEDMQGIPMTGYSGQSTRNLLVQCGIKQFYITNVIKVRPPDNRLSVYSSAKGQKWKAIKEFFEFKEMLHAELNVLRPKLVIAMGNASMYALTGHYGIGNHRGSVYKARWLRNKVDILCTYHMAYILRQYKSLPLMHLDILRASEILGGKLWEPPKRELIYAKTVDDVEYWCAKIPTITDEASVDIESRGKYITLVGIGFDNLATFQVEMTNANGSPRFTVKEEMRVWRALQHLLTNKSMKFYYQNNFYDRSMFNFHGVKTAPPDLDTMIGFKLAYPEFEKGLDTIASVYPLKEPFYKQDRKIVKEVNESGTTDKSPHDVFLAYNGKDCGVTREAAAYVKRDLQATKMWDHYQQVSRTLAEACFQAGLRGFKIDLEERASLTTRAQILLKGWNDTVYQHLGRVVNIASPKQTAEALRELGYQNVTSTGRLEMLKLLRQNPTDPALNAMLKIRRMNKFLGTYLTASLSHDDRLRFTLGSESTETGRPASRKFCHNSGFNICATPRNVSGNPLAKEFRNMIIADEGKLLISADQEQAESRLTAVWAQCAPMMKVFEEDRDFHAYMGSIFFDMKEADIKKDSLQRDVSKAGGHAIHYGMKEKRMSNEVLRRLEIYIASTACAVIISNVHARHKEVQTVYWTYVERQLHDTRVLRNPFGRVRRFNDRWGPDMLSEGFSYLPQSTSGDITNWTIVRLFKEYPWIEFKLHTYDGLICQVDEDRAEEASRIIKEIMETPINIRGCELIIPCEVKIGRSWGRAKVWQ